MPGYELLGSEELDSIKSIFEKKAVLFAHGFDEIRSNYHVREFEDKIKHKFDIKHALCVSSGTAALKIALKALGVSHGDYVITQGFNFIATVEAIHDLGAIPMIVGVDASLNMSAVQLEKAINSKTKAIVAVHMLGVSADIVNIVKIARKYNIPVIEDACEAIGGRYDNKFLGTVADVGVFSFDFGKNITTGEGGAILTNNFQLYDYCRMYHDHGHMNTPGLPRGQDDIAMPGFNYRMTEISGAIGKVQLSRLDFINSQHKIKYDLLSNRLQKKYTLRMIPEGSTPSYDTFIFRVESDAERARIIDILNKLNIGTKNLPDAIRWHCAYYWSHIVDPKNMPNIDQVYDELCMHIAVPIRIGLDTAVYETAIEAILN